MKKWCQITRPLNLSGFETDDFNSNAQDSFDELLGSFMGRDITIYEKKIYIPGSVTRAVIQNVTSDVLNNSAVRQILARIGTLRCGQYVYDGKNMWLVCTLSDDNKIYEKAIMWLCKHSIKFVSPLTGDVVEYPCYSQNSTQYGTGESHKPIMSIIDAQRLVYVPFNDETILLDNGYRFVIDKNKENPTAYKLTQVDSESYSVGANGGLIQWSIQQDQTRSVDNTTDMIADNTTTEQRKGSW